MNLCKKIESFVIKSSVNTNKNNINTRFSDFGDRITDNQQYQKILMRDYIHHKLYSENSGYYSNKNKNPIGRLENPLNFKEMRGISDYSYELNIKYPKSTWMTCPELLRPYFGFSIGNYIDKHIRICFEMNKTKIQMNDYNNIDVGTNSNNIKIFEIGCGMGGAIDSILDYLKNFNIKEYRKIEYVGLELNPYMAEFTENLLKRNHSSLYENGQIKVVNKSLYDLEDSLVCDSNTFVLAINYFNSTPHDKIFFDKNFEKILRKDISNMSPLNGSINKLLSKKQIFQEIHSHYREYLLGFLERNKGIIKETYVESIKGIDLSCANSRGDSHHNSANGNTYNTSKIKFKQSYLDLKDEKIIDYIIPYIMTEDVKEFILGTQFYNIEKSRQRKSEDWFIKSLKNFYEKFNNENKLWLPTTAMDFFQKVDIMFPKNHLIVLDFDILPSKIFNCDYKGKNAPVVYSIIENSFETKTYNSIFESWETQNLPVNIYFPIDFQHLQLMNKLKTAKDTTLNKFNYFMNEHSMSEWCESKSGFNPLTDTHHNTTFMLSLI